MIVKFFKRGTGRASGVFDYLLKDRNEPDGLRRDAELLRGDVVNQSLLIDSLDFKQKYTSGCLSFSESADEVTLEQKEKLMDSFEETIRAGLDSDCISVVWVEHRDKGRLELNFVFANVELKHGRNFQPYVHVHDLKRVNAWKEMANIEYGFKDPNDPANKRLMAQRDNLPRDVKQAREAITEGLTAMIVEGVIKSRDDVVQSLKEGGFEIARETDKAISIKNPNGKRNIRLTGGLYERDFNFSREIQAEVRRDSRDYRSRAEQRYLEAKQLYDSETERKREYHKQRHSKPKQAKRTVTASVSSTRTSYVFSPYNLYRANPSPYLPSFKRKRTADKSTDRKSQRSSVEFNRPAPVRDRGSYQIRHDEVVNDTSVSGLCIDDDRLNIGSVYLEESHQADSYLLRTAESNNVQVSNDEQTAIRQDRASIRRTAGHDTATASNARQQRQGYSSLAKLVRTINNNADTALGTLTDITRAIEEHNQRAEQSVQGLDKSTQYVLRTNEQLNDRHNRTLQHSNSTRRAYEAVSEYDCTRKHSIERYKAVREQIGRLSEFAGKNHEQSEVVEKTARTVAEATQQLRLVQQQEQQKQQEARVSRSYRPRMR